jgi:bifunctional oligoribonuclease and PAP phosphatase NrnA
MTPLDQLVAVPPARAAALGPVLDRLRASQRVVLTTHLNADGDGAGSQAAVAAWLEAIGKHVAIVNPTPLPGALRFLVHREGLLLPLGSDDADVAIAAADTFLVLDTSEPKRVGALAGRMPHDRTLVVDHHPPGSEVVGSLAVQDPSAAATGELVYDLLRLDGYQWSLPVALGVYVALVSDTGSFRFANASPRVHGIAALAMLQGIDPEEVYGRLFGQVPLRRLELLREALGTLRTTADGRIAWILVPREMVSRVGADHEDLEGLIEHARSLEATEVALLFRELPDGATKISFRSRGGTDVNRVARGFGGGGHAKASGALVAGPPAEVVPRVLAAVEEALRGG